MDDRDIVWTQIPPSRSQLIMSRYSPFIVASVVGVAVFLLAGPRWFTEPVLAFIVGGGVLLWIVAIYSAERDRIRGVGYDAHHVYFETKKGQARVPFSEIFAVQRKPGAGVRIVASGARTFWIEGIAEDPVLHEIEVRSKHGRGREPR